MDEKPAQEEMADVENKFTVAKKEVGKIWDEFRAKNKVLAERFMKVHNKREVKIMVSGDMVLAQTLREELHSLVDEMCDLQDATLSGIHDDPAMLVGLISHQMENKGT